jgi:hypothetical protein
VSNDEQVKILLDVLGRDDLYARVQQEVERYGFQLSEIRDISLYKNTCFIGVIRGATATVSFDLNEGKPYNHVSARTVLQTGGVFAVQEN